MSGTEPRGSAPPPATSAFRFWVPVSVRYSDLDDQGHVNNAVFFTYFEQGRIGYFDAVRKLGREAAARGETVEHAAGSRAVQVAPGATDDRLELPLVVSEASCAYRRPIASLAPISVGVRTPRLARASLVIEYAVCAEPHGLLYATGSTTLVCVDVASGRPRALPAWTIAAVRRLEPELGG
jgi:acyl-CoA thioester hydrolase